jgi:glutathione S-transferase
MLNLHVGPVGSIALVSHIALEEAGADYTVTKLDFSKNEQRGADYAKVNPKGRVPALVTDRGVLTETPAILLYTAQTHPQANLAPLDDPFALAELQAFTNYLCSTAHPAHAHKMRGHRWSDDAAVIEALKIKVPQNMTDCFTYIEANYLNGPWVMGSAFTVADPYLFQLANWMEGDSVDTSKFAKVIAHRTAMAARPAVQRVLKSYEA